MTNSSGQGVEGFTSGWKQRGRSPNSGCMHQAHFCVWMQALHDVLLTQGFWKRAAFSMPNWDSIAPNALSSTTATRYTEHLFMLIRFIWKAEKKILKYLHNESKDFCRRVSFQVKIVMSDKTWNRFRWASRRTSRSWHFCCLNWIIIAITFSDVSFSLFWYKYAESYTNAGLSCCRCANNDTGRKHVKQTKELD